MNFTQMLERLGRTSDLARELGETFSTVHRWKSRNSIPSRYWLKIVDVADKRGEMISLRMLAEAAEQDS